jgi:hydrogenase maturation protease
VLVAGIGNVFLGDDGFGVEVARRLRERVRPPGVEVADFGIRGVDLAYALGEGWDAAILVDAAPRGQPPGTLHVIEPETDAPPPAALDGHAMDPLTVLGLARRLGHVPARVLVVGCEPASVSTDPDDVTMRLSAPVTAAVEGAMALVEGLVAELVARGR